MYRGAVLAAALAAAVLVTGAGASALSAFHTPAWSTECAVVAAGHGWWLGRSGSYRLF